MPRRLIPRLIQCPTCGRKVSSKAPACPACGHPLEPVGQRETDPVFRAYRRRRLVTALILCIIGLVIGIAIGDEKTAILSGLGIVVAGLVLGLRS